MVNATTISINSELKGKDKLKITPGHFQILGTDLEENTDQSFGPRFDAYRKEWAQRAIKNYPGEFPLHLDIETVSACNFKCKMCPWHGADFTNFNLPKEKKDWMPIKLFKRIIDEGSKYGLPSIKLNYRGEPMMHLQLEEMIKYAKLKGVLEVQMNTNGSLLTERRARSLIDAGMDRFIFSFDGASKEIYEFIRVGGKYDIVVRNIKKLVEIRNSMGRKTPSVRVQMCVQPENLNELDKFVQMWYNVVNRIGFGILKNPNEVMNYERFPCPQLFQRLIICYDGEVRLCCGDWNGELSRPIGKLTEGRTIHEIWNNDPYIKLVRKMHIDGKSREIDVCAKCDINTTFTDSRVDAVVNKYNNRPKHVTLADLQILNKIDL